MDLFDFFSRRRKTSDFDDYKIFYGRHGRTVDYEDARGKFTFTFDVNMDEYEKSKMKGGKIKLLFEGGGMPFKDNAAWDCHTPEDREHLALMLQRARECLASLGYDMEVV